MKRILAILLTGIICAWAPAPRSDAGRRAEALFVGSSSNVQATWLATKLFKSGVNITYTERQDDLQPAKLAAFDAVIYCTANPPSAAAQAALRAFVDGGKGLLVLHQGAEGLRALAWTKPSGNPGKGRVVVFPDGKNDEAWKHVAFLDRIRNAVLEAIGEEARGRIAAAKIPDVDIYNSDTIADYTKRYNVPKFQEALPPGESNKLTQVPTGFEIQLFAQEPDITKPIAMAWDERGRLWIVETVDYPNDFVETDSTANDRIKICEDTDGDGRADKFTVFADSLNIPTSIAFANGGVIVSMAPNFLFLQDTDGDDKADVRKVIFTGWGKQDTHAGPSNLQYGFDNKIWGVTGYSGFDGTINGERQKFPQGVYHFKPDGSDFKFLGRTSNNTWGLGFTEDNHVFISTANNTHSAWFSMPFWYMQRKLDVGPADPVQKIDGHYDVHAMTPNLRQVDVMGGFTSATGHHFYTARSFPKEYWNRVAFVNEPTVRLVHSAIIEKDGAGFKEKDGWNLMASSDEWFGPVHAETGPDGAVWVADWYNFIIQHNVFVKEQAPRETILPFTEQPHGKGNAFESEHRDVSHGRIYRVVYKNAKPYAPVRLSRNDTASLRKGIMNENMFWRMTAQRLIVEEKHTDMAPVLRKIAAGRAVDAVGLNSPVVHALWTLHGLGLEDAATFQVFVAALKHPASGVRKAAVEVLPKTAKGQAALIASGILQDRDLQVRLAAIKQLVEYPESEAAGGAVYRMSAVAQNGKDPFLAKALLAAAVRHEKGFLSAAGKATTPAGAFTKQLTEALYHEDYALDPRGFMPAAPDVNGKEITIRAAVGASREVKTPSGTILSQGDAANGYTLAVRNGKLQMDVVQAGKTYRAVSTDELPEKADVEAQLGKNGNIRLKINGEAAGSGKAPGLFNVKTDGWRTEDRFAGQLRNVTLTLDRSAPKPASEAAPALVIDLKVVKDIMQYDKKKLSVKAGQKVTIRLENPDGMQHNLLILKPGTLAKVGAAADAMVRDPNASKMQYVPKVPEVLHATRLLNPGETVSLTFTAPALPGDYPFVCTFPGHWRGMNGILQVVK
ncbi:PVC-type heme-binding CxxCH protein [Chitinophaga caseinilytica]|uniref:PVC-type heme-binding CxxCH protein n=1 Tax=Chitinophaga caseinilytica TaxID=2267521 RepID=A0ABZ2YZJ6_9BACT